MDKVIISEEGRGREIFYLSVFPFLHFFVKMLVQSLDSTGFFVVIGPIEVKKSNVINRTQGI